MWNDRYRFADPTLAGVCFDPATMAVGATVAGAGVKAYGSLASGSYAAEAGRLKQQEANFQADQLEQNASQAIAAGQRTMFDAQTRARMLGSQIAARAESSGISSDTGSPVALAGQIAGRGSFQAAMDLFNGLSTATGLRNKAAGIRYTGELEKLGGEQAQKASYLAAGADLLSGFGSAAKIYGEMGNPTKGGPAGPRA